MATVRSHSPAIRNFLPGSYERSELSRSEALAFYVIYGKCLSSSFMLQIDVVKGTMIAALINAENLNYPAKVFYVLRQDHPVRKIAIKVVDNKWFDRVTMMVILLNCITMAMFRPCSDYKECTVQCKILNVMDHMIYIYFVVELALKIVAMGIFGKVGYLVDTWNRLDCFIVFTGALEYILGDIVADLNFTVIRTFRVLRPLRAVNRIPPLRILVGVLLDTLPMLTNVLLLCFCVFFVFAIIGVQLWSGLLRNRCAPDSQFLNVSTMNFPHAYYIPDYPEESDYLCSLPKHGGTHRCTNLPPTRDEHGIPCNGSLYDEEAAGIINCIDYNQYFNVCTPTDDNPFDGSLSFDNIMFAIATIFVAISMDGWVDIMYSVQQVYSVWTWVYFLLLIVVGSFYMVNMFLAVISAQFGNTKDQEMQKIQSERAMAMLDSALEGKTKKKTLSANSLKLWVSKSTSKWRKVKAETNHRNNLMKTELPDVAPDAVLLINVFTDVIQSFWSLISAAESEYEVKESVNRLALEGLRFGSLPGVMDLNRIQKRAVAPVKNEAAVSDILDRWARLADVNSNTGDLVLKDEEIEKSWLQKLVSILSEFFLDLVEGKFFRYAVMIAILCNTFSMAIEHHDQPDDLTRILKLSNYFFTGFFALEMAMKILAFGPVGYVKDGFNIFDGTIVLLSLVELIMGGEGGLSVLRAFRLLRVFKLIRFIPSLRYQLVVMLKCLGNVRMFFVLLCLFIFIFTLLGMVIFGAKLCEDSDGNHCECEAFLNGTCACSRDNFDTFFHASLTVFVVLSGTYADVLFTVMSRLGPWASLYFFSIVVFGNYIMLNLLICILLEGFEDTDEKAVADELEPHLVTQLKKRNFSQCSHRQNGVESVSDYPTTSGYSSDHRQLVHTESISGYDTLRSRNHADFRPPATVMDWDNAKMWRQTYRSPTRGHFNVLDEQYTGNTAAAAIRRRKRVSAAVDSSPNAGWNRKSEWLKHLREAKTAPAPPHYCPVHGIAEAAVWPFPDYLAGHEGNTEDPYDDPPEISCFGKREKYSLYLFSDENWLRKKCQHLISQKWFDHVILVFIGLNCLTFTMEKPSLAEDGWERKLLTISNYIFTAIFSLEMLIKVAAKGFIMLDNAYFRDPWNILDGTLVMISWVSLAFDIWASTFDASQEPPGIFSLIRVLRLLRALRPLRVVNRSPGLKIVVETLISSLKPIGSVMLICLLFFLIFAILGVQLFKGKLYFCDTSNLDGVTNRTTCEAHQGNIWRPFRYNFDNIGQAMLLLFVLSTLDNWNEMLYQGMDIVGVDQQPQENYSRYNALYYVVFVTFVGFFVLNMFVGVVVENFQQNSVAIDSTEKSSEKKTEGQQVEIIEGYEFISAASVEYYSMPRRALYGFVNHRYFDLGIAAIIMANILTMSMEFYQMPDGLIYGLKICNFIFTGIFAVEALLKLLAFGTSYFSDHWNKFDFFIVILSFVGIFLEEMKTVDIPVNPTMIRVMRILRITRVLRLLKMAKGVRAILDCVAQALPQVGNLAVLFLLLFFIFAALGVELFGKIECSAAHPCEGMSGQANFASFPMAFLTLFRVATGDNWSAIMRDTMKPDCDTGSMCKSNCCVAHFACAMYFVLFVLCSTYVLMNLVVAVLLKYLEESSKSANKN